MAKVLAIFVNFNYSKLHLLKGLNNLELGFSDITEILKYKEIVTVVFKYFRFFHINEKIEKWENQKFFDNENIILMRVN